MPVQNLQVSIESFEFPKSLNPNKANFRFVVDTRFLGSDGSVQTESNAAPALDSYWDCDWNQAYGQPSRYVGPDPKGTVNRPVKPDAYGTTDPAKFNPHEKAAAVLRAERLISLNCTIFDVDRKDFWDEFLTHFANIVETLLGKVGKVLPDSIGLPDNLKSAITKKLAGPGDRIIGSAGISFVGIEPLGTHVLKVSVRKGDYGGDYRVSFNIEEI